MKDKILKLCRRLKKCSLDELVQITEIEERKLKQVISFLKEDGSLIEKNGIFTIGNNDNLSPNVRKNLNFMLPYHSPESVDMILKGFCLEIPPSKMCKMADISNAGICNFYFLIRKNIYERQYENLTNLFSENPQMAKYRIFYNQYAYFYVYNNKIYVSHKQLKSLVEKDFTKSEMQEFKKVYCYLSRIKCNRMNEIYMYYKLAEYIWRKEKSFDELYSDLKNNLFC